MLVNLKKKVAPKDFAAQLDLRNQYRHMTKPPNKHLSRGSTNGKTSI
jgi:hypothetical protein